MNALLRPEKSANWEVAALKRLILEYSHSIVGRCTTIIGVVALFIGIKHLGERYGKDAQRLTWVFNMLVFAWGGDSTVLRLSGQACQ